MDEIDRILATEALIEPSARFAPRVMHEVLREGRTPPPFEFPWRRVAAAAALLTCAGIGLAQVPGALETLERLDWPVAGVVLSVLTLSFGLASGTLWLAWRTD